MRLLQHLDVALNGAGVFFEIFGVVKLRWVHKNAANYNIGLCFGIAKSEIWPLCSVPKVGTSLMGFPFKRFSAKYWCSFALFVKILNGYWS
jgi:hypothetical protein